MENNEKLVKCPFCGSTASIGVDADCDGYQGRLVVLPFAVYTEVWSAEPFKDGKPRRGRVTVFEADEDGAYAFWVSFSPEPLSAEFLRADVGKTVFLTREEAEAALKEAKKNA